VRLVLHAAEATAPYSLQAISRARKKMMAEIALSGDEMVIDDVAYSRNDAATLLDDISEDLWRVHCIIYTFPGMLQFLEKQVFDHEELKEADAYLYDQRFVNVVSPFFAYSFNAVSGSFIRQQKFEELLLLLQYQNYILPDHQHEAFQKIRTYLDELNYTLRNLSWEKFFEDETILHFVFEEDWQKSMNALPSSFNTLRDEIAAHLIEIVLRFQQKATWYYLHQVLVNLRTLDTNDFNRAEINRIDEVIYENTQIESKGKSSGKDGSWTRGIFWGIWLFLMIFRNATCNGSGGETFGGGAPPEPRPASTLSSTTEQKNETLLLQSLDSMLKAKKRTTQATSMKSGDPAFFFSDDPKAARNDSLLVVNNTGYDAVFLYFKDIPGHTFSGKLPKLYSMLIKKGESQKVFVVAGNGRVYFAFGEGWGELKKPLSIPFPDYAGRIGIVEPVKDSLLMLYFFSSGNGAVQKYLQNPLYINAAGASKDYIRYRYLNTTTTDGEPTLYLSARNGSIQIKADGPLLVKETRNG
jgi:hypothetical protein